MTLLNTRDGSGERILGHDVGFPSSGAVLHVGAIERRPQSLGKLLCIIIGPEVHEEKVRRIIDHVTVQRGYLDTVIAHRLKHRIDFLA